MLRDRRINEPSSDASAVVFPATNIDEDAALVNLAALQAREQRAGGVRRQPRTRWSPGGWGRQLCLRLQRGRTVASSVPGVRAARGASVDGNQPGQNAADDSYPAPAPAPTSGAGGDVDGRPRTRGHRPNGIAPCSAPVHRRGGFRRRSDRRGAWRVGQSLPGRTSRRERAPRRPHPLPAAWSHFRRCLGSVCRRRRSLR